MSIDAARSGTDSDIRFVDNISSATRWRLKGSEKIGNWGKASLGQGDGGANGSTEADVLSTWIVTYFRRTWGQIYFLMFEK